MVKYDVFLGLCRLWGRESWWGGTIVGVEPEVGFTVCGEWIAIGPYPLVES
jgi:hypothetical protein